MSRRSYRGLMLLPAYGLFGAGRLVATVRARTAEEARDVFRRASSLDLRGDRVRKL